MMITLFLYSLIGKQTASGNQEAAKSHADSMCLRSDVEHLHQPSDRADQGQGNVKDYLDKPVASSGLDSISQALPAAKRDAAKGPLSSSDSRNHQLEERI